MAGNTDKIPELNVKMFKYIKHLSEKPIGMVSNLSEYKKAFQVLVKYIEEHCEVE